MGPSSNRRRVIAAAVICLLGAAGGITLGGLRAPAARPAAQALASPIAAIVPAAPLVAAAPGAEGAERQFVGVVLSDESVEIAARHEGRLLALSVRLGDHVAKGAVIASLDTQATRLDLAMGEASLAAAEAQVEQARIELAEAADRAARGERLNAEGLITAQDLASARFQRDAAGARVAARKAELSEKRANVHKLRQIARDEEIRAPFDGMVAARYVDPGAIVTPSTPIIRLIHSRARFVRFVVPEDEAPSLAVGKPVRVLAGESIFRGVIEKIAPEVDPASRMVIAEARLEQADAPEGRLLSGKMARIALHPADAEGR